MIASRRARGSRPTNRSSRIDGSSAQWRSSRTSTSAPCPAVEQNRSTTASNRRNRAPSSAMSNAGASASSGRSSSRPSPSGAWVAGSVIASARNSCRQGQYAGAPSPSEQRDQSTGDRTRAAASVTRRVLPMPASPPTKATTPWPRSAAPTAETSAPSCVSRPTNGSCSVITTDVRRPPPSDPVSGPTWCGPALSTAWRAAVGCAGIRRTPPCLARPPDDRGSVLAALTDVDVTGAAEVEALAVPGQGGSRLRRRGVDRRAEVHGGGPRVVHVVARRGVDVEGAHAAGPVRCEDDLPSVLAHVGHRIVERRVELGYRLGGTEAAVGLLPARVDVLGIGSHEAAAGEEQQRAGVRLQEGGPVLGARAVGPAGRAAQIARRLPLARGGASPREGDVAA